MNKRLSSLPAKRAVLFIILSVHAEWEKTPMLLSILVFVFEV
jgi:hypothetical protein